MKFFERIKVAVSPTMTFKKALRQGISLGISLGREQPDKTCEELMAEIDNLNVQLEKLSMKDLKKLAGE